MSYKFTSKVTLTRIFERISLIFIKKADIIDNLNSTDVSKPLSSKQGNVINTKIDDLITDMTPLTETECDTIIQGASVSAYSEYVDDSVNETE